MWETIKGAWNTCVQKVQAVAEKGKALVAAGVTGLVSFGQSAYVHATTGTSLIPTGSLDQAVADIEATGQDAFSIIVPVVVTIAALLIAVKLIKRFLNRA